LLPEMPAYSVSCLPTVCKDDTACKAVFMSKITTKKTVDIRGILGACV